MNHLIFHRDSLSFADLSEEISLDVSAKKGNVLSLDIYGPEKIHPSGHFAYWNCKLPDGTSKVSIKIDLHRISFYSTVFLNDGKRMSYADHWINQEFEFAGQLNISATLWSGDKQLESKTFEVSLSAKTQEKLRHALYGVHRLDSNRLFINHFCEDEIPPPKLLVIESTSRCNLKCPMCPRTIDMSPSGTYGDLDESILANLENEIRKTESICLSWMGEPLMNRRLPEIVERIKSINPAVLVSMTSNGALLSEIAAENLIRCGVDSINISIDAADPEIYGKIRIGTNLETIIKNIKILQSLRQSHASAKPDTCIAYVAGRENIGQMPGIVDMAYKLGIKHVSLAIMDDFALTKAYKERLDLSSDIVTLGRTSFSNAESSAGQKNIDLIFEMPIQFFHFLGIKRAGCEVEDILLDNDLSGDEISRLGMQKGCQVPWQDSFVAHNGDVHPCCVSPRILGNLRQQTFEEIWNGEQYRSFRRKLKSSDTNEECRRCRRAIWNKIGIVESAKDWMEVGRSEIHGLGWGMMNTDTSGRPFRTISRKATFFLHDSEKPYLALTLGNEQRKIAVAQVQINDTDLGNVVIPYGWQTEYFDVSHFTKGGNYAGTDIQHALLALDEAQDGLLKVTISLSAENMVLKIAGAALLDENEVDKKTRMSLQSGKEPISRMLAMVRHAGYYTDKIRKKLLK